MSSKILQSDSNRRFTLRDLERAWKNFDWEAHCRRVDGAIAPVIEAYKLARARSYANGRDYVFI